jgi:hypothetical protein
MRSVSFRITAVIAAAVLLWVGRLAWDYFDPNSIAHQAMQIQLKLFGEVIYEFHANTGRWPSQSRRSCENLLAGEKLRLERDCKHDRLFVATEFAARPPGQCECAARVLEGQLVQQARSGVGVRGRLADRTHARRGTSRALGK